jgi:prevent-host-death family protein
MATIHISRSEAEGDFSELITRAANGDEIVIEENSAPVAVLRSPVDKRHVRLLSESLRIAKERGSKVTLDGGFEDDLNAVIESHPEPLRDPWA